MDNAVALVQAYLRVNGYFTVSEYPVIEALDGGGYRTITDLDILAFRFPHAGRLVPGTTNDKNRSLFTPDPALGASGDQPDLIIGEVKEGKAELNRAAQDPAVMAVALRRFGCCVDPELSIIEKLTKEGSVRLPSGYQVRLVAFGNSKPEYHPHFRVVLLQQVRDFLSSYIRDYWEILRHGQFKDQGFGFLLTLEKIRNSEK